MVVLPVLVRRLFRGERSEGVAVLLLFGVFELSEKHVPLAVRGLPHVAPALTAHRYHPLGRKILQVTQYPSSTSSTSASSPTSMLFSSGYPSRTCSRISSICSLVSISLPRLPRRRRCRTRCRAEHADQHTPCPRPRPSRTTRYCWHRRMLHRILWSDGGR